MSAHAHRLHSFAPTHNNNGVYRSVAFIAFIAMDAAYANTRDEVLAFFSTSLEAGLSDTAVTANRVRFGRNELPAEDATPFWKLVLKQFDDLLVKILIVAAVVDLAIALSNGEGGAGAFVEPGVIVLILVANATVGVVTETNAESAIEELRG